ncbi:hypothetical protein E4T44_07392 [Aureobasidium sp. EXF-8845]|nr:hypothetical protein E4T44_07392 [Aureobasidium sp. EXF-8845]KAI4846621.1 hypothetical protein E4T45_07166 [Aureobasidium sp. EXF-8846]
MEENNQRPNWPPAPTVEDEPASSDQTTTMPDAQNGTSASAEAANAHIRDPSTPVNNGTTTTPINDNAPTTPVDAAAADPPVDRVQIVLKDQTGAQVAFGVKSNTRMEKVQNAYADRAGRPVSSLRFFFDGHRVLPDDTVATLDMDDDDIIEVMTEQIGGHGKLRIASTKLTKYVAKRDDEVDYDDEIPFVVNAVEIGGRLINEMEFVIGPNVKVKDFMDAWAERAGCAVDEVVFRRNPDKEGPGLPFDFEDETFGDIDFIFRDRVFVSAYIDEPTNLVRPREEVSIKKINTRDETPEDTVLITVNYLAEDDVPREIHCKMTKAMPFDKFIGMYSKRWDIDPSAQRLTFNGKTVFPSDTPASIGAEHGAVLNIVEDTHFFAMDLTLG